MATVTASLSSRVDERGKSEILLRFCGGADHVYRLHSDLYIARVRWKDGAIAMPRLGTDELHELTDLQTRLDELKAHLITRFTEADKDIVDRRWMQAQVKEFQHPDGDRKKLLLLDAFDRFSAAQDVSARRRMRYDVTRRALERWQVYRGAPLRVEHLTKDDVEEFNDFLRNEHRYAKSKRWAGLYADCKQLPQPRSANSLLEYHKVLRALYNWLRRKGVTQNNPYLTYEVGTAVYGTPYYITTEEVDQLYRTDLSARPALAVQRDIFVFQCNVGCRVGDLFRFRKDDVQDSYLEYIPGKTSGTNPQTIRVPLNATAREIIARYAHAAWPKLLPFISPQKYNDDIKDVFTLAGLTRRVTVLDPLTRKEVKRPLNEVASSHLARRTFIGNLYRQVKDPNLIASMSGHAEGSKAFARYRAIDDDMKAELVELLEGKPAGK